MTRNLRSSLNTGLNNGLRQSISGGVNGLGFFRTASLDLQFASKKTLNDRVSNSNLITFTRASSATYVDGNGIIQSATTNIPRFDHDPVTGESLGLLIEESRTNLMTYSEQLDNAVYTKTGTTVVTPNYGLAPDGTNTADKVTFGLASDRIFRNLSVTGAVTFSVYVRTVSGTTSARLQAYNATDGATTKQFTANTEWQRVSLTATLTAASTAFYPAFPLADGGELLVWGAQLEEGSFSTSYIPTTSSTVTRAADVAEITGTNFSSFYNQSEGTVFADVGPTSQSSVSAGRPFMFHNGTSSDRIGSNFAFSSAFNLFYNQGGNAPVDLGNIPGLPRDVTAAIAYKSGDYRGAHDGNLALSDSTAAVPSVNTLSLGFQGYSSAAYHNGHIKRLAYFPTRLPDATLQNITS